MNKLRRRKQQKRRKVNPFRFTGALEFKHPDGLIAYWDYGQTLTITRKKKRMTK